MKLSVQTKLLIAVAFSQVTAFQHHPIPNLLGRSSWQQRPVPSLYLSTPSPDDMRRIMEEESMNPATLAESAERMKSMTTEVRFVFPSY